MVAYEISRIHARSRGTYGKRRIKAALLAECEMIVNHKLVASIMTDRQGPDQAVSFTGDRPPRHAAERPSAGSHAWPDPSHSKHVRA
ncbi:transposase [Nocardia asiatica]|uniref:transposase n=1 Tax=Nocardia asiatica TaxID=209252 RepID=UPI003EE21FCC